MNLSNLFKSKSRLRLEKMRSYEIQFFTYQEAITALAEKGFNEYGAGCIIVSDKNLEISYLDSKDKQLDKISGIRYFVAGAAINKIIPVIYNAFELKERRIFFVQVPEKKPVELDLKLGVRLN